MTTTAASLIEQVRSRLLDYGNGVITLAAAISDTSGTSVSLSSVADVAPKQFLLVDSEMLEVVATYDGNPSTVTVVRGARGSTAATHTSGVVTRIDPVFGQHEYLRFLNQALGASFPTLYSVSDSHTGTITANIYEYSIPAACNKLARVEIETSVADVFEVSRQWDYVDNAKIIIEDAGTIPTGRAIRFIGYSTFTMMTVEGSLDTDYPDTDANAIEYLVVKACSNALRARQAPIARRDSFIGVTDSFQQAQPFMSTLSAKDYEAQAKSLLKQIRMPRLPEFCSDPGRVYYGRCGRV